jgi:hypothetical protein
MAIMTFKIVPHANHSFSVNMQAADGRLTTVAGFISNHEASAWIVQTQRMLHLPATSTRSPTHH